MDVIHRCRVPVEVLGIVGKNNAIQKVNPLMLTAAKTSLIIVKKSFRF